MKLKKKKIFSLLGDIVDTVRGFLCERMINTKNYYIKLGKNNFFIEKHIVL